MNSVRTHLLLVSGLLSLGWGVSAWLEQDAAWTQTGGDREVETHEQVDIRRLIADQDSGESMATGHDADPLLAPEADAADIELMSGTSPRAATTNSPAWLTGEIEF
jgi:hypothetical protein